MKIKRLDPSPVGFLNLRPEDIEPITDHGALLAGRGAYRVVAEDEARRMFPDPAARQ